MDSPFTPSISLCNPGRRLHRSAPPILGPSRGEPLYRRCGMLTATRLRQPSSSESRGCSYMVGSGDLDSRIRNPRCSPKRESWYRLYAGEFGRIACGNQVMYVHRSLWSGTDNTPEAHNLVVYSTLRFYLP